MAEDYSFALVVYDDYVGAKSVFNILQKLQEEKAIDIKEAAVVTRGGSGKIAVDNLDRQEEFPSGEMLLQIVDQLNQWIRVQKDQDDWTLDPLLADLPAPLITAGLRRAALAAAPEIADELRRDHVAAVADAVRDEVRRPRSYTWPGGLRVSVSAGEVELT